MKISVSLSEGSLATRQRLRNGLFDRLGTPFDLFRRFSKPVTNMKGPLPVLLGLLLMAAPAAQAQFTFTTNSGVITITGYTGPGGAVSIPGTTNGLPVTGIATFAFANSALTSVTIPSSVTNIGVAPFIGCSSLTAITVDPSNPAYSSIAGVLFNKSQTVIIQFPGAEAGSYPIPNSVTTIGDIAFNSCADLTGVSFPSSVTSIGYESFEGTILTSVTIPNSVTNIGSQAFYGLSSLTNATIGNSGTASTNGMVIGTSAFEYCSHLTGVTLGTNVTIIGVQAFFACASLTNLTIPGSVTTIGNQAFYSCSGLTGLYFEGNAPYENGPNVGYQVFVGDGNAIAYYIPGTTGWGYFSEGLQISIAPWIPGSLNVTISPVSAVAAGAQWQVDGGPWQNSGATEANLSPGNHTLSFSALNGWTPPASQVVSVSTNLVTTSTGTYVPITGSLQVTITPGPAVTDGAKWQVDWGGFLSSGATVGNLLVGNHTVNFSALSGWPTPVNLNVIVNSNQTTFVTAIYSAPSQTGSLQVRISPPEAIAAGAQWNVDNGGFQNSGSTVTNLSVGNHTVSFSTISGLTTPASQTNYINANFTTSVTGSYALQAQYYSAPYDYCIIASNTITITGYSGSGGAVAIPSVINNLPVTGIGGNAFKGFSSLTNVTIPNTVTIIGDGVFDGCTHLTAITVDPSNPAYTSIAGVLFNKSQTALIQCPGAEAGSYTIPNSVTRIEADAFYGCALTSVTIPNSVTSIGELAFWACSSLTNAMVGTNVTSIGSEAFSFCGLISITIPSSVTNIGESAFSYSGLRNVTFGTNVTSIWEGAFEECSLTSVAIPNSVTNIGDYAFYGCPLTSVTIPNSVTSIGADAFYDCALTSISIPNSVTNIGDYAFGDCSLTRVTIPNSVTSIGSGVFEDCSSLTNVTIPNSVTSIGSSEFENCSSLTSVTIPDSVISIGDGAFLGCASLSNVRIGSNVINIGSGAFSDCDSLTSVTIPTSVSSIGDGAFAYCQNLTSVYFEGNAPGVGAGVFTFVAATAYYLPGTSGWSVTFAGLYTVMLNPITGGSLQVSINPPGAITSGAQWQVDGGILQPSGATVLDLAAGGHTVEFSTASGWTTPANQTVFVIANSTAKTNGTYVHQFGSLEVTISPASAISAGAQWQLDGGTAQNSGATINNLSAGSHTLSFTPIPGWNTPPDQIAMITGGVTAAGAGVYTIVAPRTFTVLHDFTATFGNGVLPGIGVNGDGAHPDSHLTISGSALYGTAPYGGIWGYGTVFKVNTDGTGFTNLYDFTGGSDGAAPNAGLTLSGNILYGTAATGGNSDYGTVFKVNTDGTGFTNLYSFTAISPIYPNYTNSDGAIPYAKLILSGNTLYGTTEAGGAFGYGGVFAVNNDGTGFTNLYNFTGGSDGAQPTGELILSGNILYGTTYGLPSEPQYTAGGAGTVFALSTDGTTFTSLHLFTAPSYYYNVNSDGAYPNAGLTISSNTLYGTTAYGGSSGNGTVFKVNTDGTDFTNLYNFIGFPSDGSYPNSQLILLGNILYGTASSGGSGNSGTLFKVNTDGTGFNTIYNFTPDNYTTFNGTITANYNSDGNGPNGGLVFEANILYGTAEDGGSSGFGTVFSFSLGPVSVAAPTLTILPFGTNVILTWPTNAAGFSLQSSTNLVSPAVWTTNSPASVVVNGQNTVTNPISGTQKFFRLSQ
jgi:uncharacterized repeat protein (TIGR03803 family)